MLLKTQSLCLAGDDLTRDIKPFRIGTEMVSHVFFDSHHLKVQHNETISLLDFMDASNNAAEDKPTMESGFGINVVSRGKLPFNRLR